MLARRPGPGGCGRPAGSSRERCARWPGTVTV